jgi:hypothetical protein
MGLTPELRRDVGIMVYIKCSNGYADGDLSLLKDFLELIDTKIAEGDKEFRLTRDECAIDAIEYYAGFGFIAIQRYFNSTYPQVMSDKNKALDACPSGLMAVLNAGANFAKHSEEWPIDQELSKREQKTLDTFCCGDHDLSWHPYINKLFSLTQSLSFTNLIPKIEEWRNALEPLQSLSECAR